MTQPPDDTSLVGGTPGSGPGRRIRLPRRPDDVRSTRLANQWTQLLAERQARMQMPGVAREPAPSAASAPSVPAGQRRVQVPYGVDVAASWGWRFLVIVLSTIVIAFTLNYLAEVMIPLLIALLVSALVTPVVSLLERLGVRRSLAALVVVVVALLFVVGLLTLAGQQIANGAQDLANQSVKGLDQIKGYLTDGPFHLSQKKLDQYVAQAQTKATEYAKGQGLGQITEIGSALGHVFAGLFIAVLSTYFFLADGTKIWAWLVRLAPRTARRRVDGSGRVAWVSLTQFVRATVIVAFADALFTSIAAFVLQVPFVLAIGVLVFLGAFIPLVGATVAGSVAVLVALVDRGPVVALIMLGAVIAVQQIEAHGLQPFLMGRWVSVHPLGVIIAIATGIIVDGVTGALIAVPFTAAVNAVVQYLAAGTSPGGDAEADLRQDYGGDPPPDPDATPEPA